MLGGMKPLQHPSQHGITLRLIHQWRAIVFRWREVVGQIAVDNVVCGRPKHVELQRHANARADRPNFMQRIPVKDNKWQLLLLAIHRQRTHLTVNHELAAGKLAPEQHDDGPNVVMGSQRAAVRREVTALLVHVQLAQLDQSFAAGVQTARIRLHCS